MEQEDNRSKATEPAAARHILLLVPFRCCNLQAVITNFRALIDLAPQTHKP